MSKLEETVALVQEEIRNTLESYVGTRNDNQTKHAVKQFVTMKLEKMKNEGHFSHIMGKMPIVDVNHEAEIENIEKRKLDLLKDYESGFEDLYGYVNGLTILDSKIKSLKQEVGDDETRICVFLKNRDFTPYVWSHIWEE